MAIYIPSKKKLTRARYLNVATNDIGLAAHLGVISESDKDWQKKYGMTNREWQDAWRTINKVLLDYSAAQK